VNHQIEITWAKRRAGDRIIAIGSYFASYKGEVIGEWRVPECDAARWLLEHGHAKEGDTLSRRARLRCRRLASRAERVASDL